MSTEAKIIQMIFNEYGDYKRLFETCETEAVEIDQNWKEGHTIYTFKDGSKLLAQYCGIQAL